MSARRRELKRLRYLRASVPIQDVMAEKLSLELCNYLGDCDFCEGAHPNARSWVLMDYGECTEAVENVCAHCLPTYYRNKQAELRFYGSREFEKICREQLKEGW